MCWCDTGQVETYTHLFYECNRNSEAGEAVLRVAMAYDRNLSREKSLRLEVECDETFLLATMTVLATGLGFIWEMRKARKMTSLFRIRAELEAAVSVMRRSSIKRLREAGNIANNMLSNFF